MKKMDMIICFILLVVSELFFLLCLGLTPTPLGIGLSITFYLAIVSLAFTFKKRLV